MNLYDGGVTSPQGFRAAGICAGLKKNRKDMAMLMSTAPCTAAGTFTSNLVKASPVVWDQNIVKQTGCARAVVINSGVANACTGRQGDEYCLETARAAAKALGIRPEELGGEIPVKKLSDNDRMSFWNYLALHDQVSLRNEGRLEILEEG